MIILSSDRKELYCFKLEQAKNNIRNMYLNNDLDWMIGFSGGKDSSVLVQIILESLLEIDKKGLKNNIYIVSSDTLIENPIVLNQLNKSLNLLQEFVNLHKLPIIVKKVQPQIEDSFWVNLIGRGYPLPNQSFRWCTDRLKIKPMANYINDLQKESNKKILKVLGVRKGESNSRDLKLNKSHIKNSNLRIDKTTGNYMFAPIEEFGLFDIWTYLSEDNLNFFKKNNDTLSILYEDSSSGTSECPSSLDDRLQKGCGNSRWGCWLCPVVKRDKSLEGFINSGVTWLKPLLDFRDLIISERDNLKNRYNGSFRISSDFKSIKLVKYKFFDLKNKDGIYFLPKKLGRSKMIFGKRQIKGKKTYLINGNKKYEVIKESDYKIRVDSANFNPYNNSFDNLFNLDFVIILDKNADNEIFSIPGFGPYSVDYREELLDRIEKLNKISSQNGLEIISQKELAIIKNLIKKIKEEIDNFKMLSKFTFEQEDINGKFSGKNTNSKI